jgi:hypothetical protein
VYTTAFKQNTPNSRRTKLTANEYEKTLIREPPQAPPTNTTINSEIRGITDLRKIYNNDSKKYSGAKYEYIQKKLTVFKDDCILLGITNGSMTTAISILLTGRALDYFYNRLSLVRQNMTFEEIVTSIEGHFETPEVRQAYLNK